MAGEKYHIHISSKHQLLDLKLKEVWQYRDLILLFTKKTFTVSYKQTILGPTWLFLSPLLSSFAYLLIFGKIAGLSTAGIPKILFYLSGTAIWGFFSSCMTGNSGTFVNNAGLFGKVYFPRLTMPISNVLSAAIKFLIQMIMVIGLLIYYCVKGSVTPHWGTCLLIPFILVQLGLLGMGVGIIISSLTTKYRDLAVLVTFGVQLWMYATPVVYPLSQLSDGMLRTIIMINPVTMPVEVFRYALLGSGTIAISYCILSVAITVIALLIGIVIFNKVERTFMDTV